MTRRVDRLGPGDLMTLWAEGPATPMHLGLAGLLDPELLPDEGGRLRLDELRTALEARLARAPELRRRIGVAETLDRLAAAEPARQPPVAVPAAAS
jgi:Wax ester synthase-like Acyl-CoA acyltransferase domain